MFESHQSGIEIASRVIVLDVIGAFESHQSGIEITRTVLGALKWHSLNLTRVELKLGTGMLLGDSAVEFESHQSGIEML